MRFTLYLLTLLVQNKNNTQLQRLQIFKLIPRGNGTYIKHLINLHTYRGNMHFEDQSIYIKELVEKYTISMVVDGNGLGRGLIDYLVKISILHILL